MKSLSAWLTAALLLLALAGGWRLPRAAAQPAAEASLGAKAPAQPTRVGVLGVDNAPFSQAAPPGQAVQENHAGLVGFEVALMDSLCRRANLSCTAVPLTNLEGRIQGVANGTLDMSIAAVSFTPGREAVVHFVRPFYYSSGVSLFADTSRGGLALFGPGAKPGAVLEDLPAGWHGVFTGEGFPRGQALCFVEGYYALPFIAQHPDVLIKTEPTLDQAVATVHSGGCAALAYDSVSPQETVGLPALAAPPAYVSPYGVVISPTAAGGPLEQRLVWALVGMMSAGNASEILALEQEWLVGNSVGPSSALRSVVDAISTFGDPLAAGPGKIPETYRLFGTRPGGRRLLRQG